MTKETGEGKKPEEKETEEKETEENKAPSAERCFNIIDSVKGGSGKTSLSLMLSFAVQRYMQEQEEKQEQEGKQKQEGKQEQKEKRGGYSLLMDMDVQGSALDHLLFEKSKTGRADRTINDAILKYYTKDTPRFISRPKLYFSDSTGKVGSGEEDATAGDGSQLTWYEIAVAMASKEVRERDRFRAVSRMNYSSLITYDAFRSGLKTVLRDANLNSYLPSKPQYIFFDMPPNSNGYSDCVPELLLSGMDGRVPSVNPRYPRNYFELMTLDQGHIMATLDWFGEFVKGEQYPFPDHFFFVFSNIPEAISRMEYTYPIQESEDICLRSAFEVILGRLNKGFKLTEEQRRRIYFVGIAYQEDYLRRCCSAGTLAASDKNGLDRSFLYPVKFLVDINGKPYKEHDCTHELLRLMRTTRPEARKG